MPGPVFTPTAYGPGHAPVIINGTLSEGNAAFIDAATGGGTYTSPININVVLGSGGPLAAGFFQINAGVPYQFTTAQHAQLVAAGVTLNAT